MIHHAQDMRPADMLGRIDCDNPCIVECGSHEGQDTERFLKAFPNCRIICFEPDPRPILRTTPPGFVCRIGDDERVTLIRAAVSDRESHATLYRSSGAPPGEKWKGITDWDHSGSLFKPTGHLKMSPWCTFPKAHYLEVPTVRLDTWLRGHSEIDSIDLLWADTQGAEAALIRGATETLVRTKWFYTEFYNKPMYEGQPDLATITKMLPGWESVATYADNALFRNTREK